MPAIAAFILQGLGALVTAVLIKLWPRLLGAAAVAGGVAVGWETGLLPLLLKAFVLALMDTVFILVDKLVTFFFYVLDGQGWDLPTVDSLMAEVPAFVIQMGSAIGLWKSIGLIWSIAVFKWIVGVFTLRIVYRR